LLALVVSVIGPAVAASSLVVGLRAANQRHEVADSGNYCRISPPHTGAVRCAGERNDALAARDLRPPARPRREPVENSNLLRSG
jgi:hypothetical protein